MRSSADYRRHAAECSRLAEMAGDRIIGGVWRRLAQRWLTCAVLTESRNPAAGESEDMQKTAGLSTGGIHRL